MWRLAEKSLQPFKRRRGRLVLVAGGIPMHPLTSYQFLYRAVHVRALPSRCATGTFNILIIWCVYCTRLWLKFFLRSAGAEAVTHRSSPSLDLKLHKQTNDQLWGLELWKQVELAGDYHWQGVTAVQASTCLCKISLNCGMTRKSTVKCMESDWVI